MDWIWKHKDWPAFRFDRKAIEPLEAEFLEKAGVLSGTIRHIDEREKQDLTIQLISEEALRTSEIEGEILDRESVQSSIQRQFGLKPPQRRISAAESGVSEMMVDVYQSFDAPLYHATLFRWHKMLTSGRSDLRDIGAYRTDSAPMQIVSNRLDTPEIHYEAPPSAEINKEMERFLSWFNATSGSGEESPLARAGIAHLYFESIHPFEDGNGRIGRAISEKSLSQSLKRPTLIALSRTINTHKKAYYSALQRNSRGDLDITDWLLFFSRIILESQKHTQEMIDFLIGKTKFYARFQGTLNERQEKVIARLFKQGPEGFKGGLSAENYIRITETSRATATRDLQDLVAKGALTKTGELRYSRYELRLD